ncbi:sel1 repeat family protein [Streptomyces luomodiensis]|uniref:Sel1 repeat family protein n=1 Tax=Streptomyces luomodiensis TaxID=3026192 RepID=A0ABY9V348_9ACTN|nr:sel1 repeat family protein [Streptomyces sp. SCA4-21]WNE99320.1 sel1 repeat family protein [Streptomyces sp. SCA4-21]
MGGLWARWRRRRDRRAARSLDPALTAKVRAAYDEGRPIPEPLARQAAEAGDPRGMTVYGIVLGKRGAYAEAVHWLGKAAATGDIQAMVVLGTLHLDLGDVGEAERHFRRAADRGHAGARLALQQMRARRNGSGH